MDLIGAIAFLFTTMQTDWVEKANGGYEKEFACKIDEAEKTSPNSLDALPQDQPFSMFVTATKDEITSARLTFVSPEHSKPLVLESDRCLSDIILEDASGELLSGGETFQCPLFTSGNRFATIYAPQDSGWFSLIVVNGGAKMIFDDGYDASMPMIYFDTYRGKCD